MRPSDNTRLRLLDLLGADSKTSKDRKCLQEPPHSAMRWEELPEGPRGVSLGSRRSPAPRTMPEIATTRDVSALSPGLLWLFLCLSLSSAGNLDPLCCPPLPRTGSSTSSVFRQPRTSVWHQNHQVWCPVGARAISAVTTA